MDLKRVNIIDGQTCTGKTSFAHFLSRIIGGDIYLISDGRSRNRFQSPSLKYLDIKLSNYNLLIDEPILPNPSTIIIDLDYFNVKINPSVHTYIITGYLKSYTEHTKSRNLGNYIDIGYFRDYELFTSYRDYEGDNNLCLKNNNSENIYTLEDLDNEIKKHRDKKITNILS